MLAKQTITHNAGYHRQKATAYNKMTITRHLISRFTAEKNEMHNEKMHASTMHKKEKDLHLITLRASCGAVYCNRSCLCVCGGWAACICQIKSDQI